MIVCPKCKRRLERINNTCKCINNHSYDIAKEGYINLLLNKTNAGDNSLMIKARNNFLKKGYYSKLAMKLTSLIDFLKINDPKIVDIACGEGYYSNYIANKYPNIIGIDISKEAIKLAAKQYKNINFIVASGKDIPIEDNSIDIILNIFSPHFTKEFLRILKPDKYLIKVTPNENHLLELKQILYDDVYLNKEKEIIDNNLILFHQENLEYKINLDNEDILNLITMTPYFYKTKESKIESLIKINYLLLTINFNFSIYKKHSTY